MWIINAQNPQECQGLSEFCNIEPATAQLLINRGIKNGDQAKSFFDNNLDNLNDPGLFHDMAKASGRIQEAMVNNEKIMIYGDYDTDGITASAYLFLVLKDIGANAFIKLPNRFTDGYGLSAAAVEEAYKKDVRLIITVDCGINAHREVQLAQKRGIDAIITDHHKIPSEGMPRAFAVINPQDERNNYPDKDITGAGVAFKLGQALLLKAGHNTYRHFELVALGTICDVAVRLGENRIICRHGLDLIRRTNNLGLKAVAEAAGCQIDRLTMKDIGFLIGPRLNAAGRMDDAKLAVDLLITENEDDARKMANKLNKLNKLRQKVGNNIFKDAERIIENQVNFNHEKILVLSSQTWHRGLTGIIASRIVRKYHLPACIIAVEDGLGVGSARSTENFPLHTLMSASLELFEDFGGHEGACGFSIKEKNIPKLRENLNQAAVQYAGDHPKKTFTIDLEINAQAVNEKLIKEMELFFPYGLGNPEPTVMLSGLCVKTETKPYGRFRSSFWAEKDNVTFEVLGPRSKISAPEGTCVDVVCRIRKKGHAGVHTWQILCEDIRPAQRD